MTLPFAHLRSNRLFARVALAAWLSANVMAPLVPAAMAAAVPAPAAKSLSLITSPLPINLATPPGKTITTDIKIKQAGPGTQKLRVSLMKFAAYGSEGKPRLLDRGPGDDYFDWVKFDKTTFDAPENVWQTIHMTINVPKSAAFGYYYGVVFSRVGDDQAPGSNTNAINGGTAVLVLLDAQVPGAKRQLKLETFTTEHRLYEYLPSSFDVKFANVGNVHMVPHGNVFIMKGKKEVGSLVLNDQLGNILPQSHRVYPTEWLDGFPHNEKIVEDGKVKLDEKQKPVTHLVWSNGGEGAKDLRPHLRFGKYTAHLFAVYDDGVRDVPMEATLEFWVIPWRFLLVVLLVILVTVFGFFGFARGAWKGLRRIGRRR